MAIDPTSFSNDLKIETPLLKGGVTYTEDNYPSFGESLNIAINNLNTLNNESKMKIEDYIIGQNTNIAEVMTSLEKASLATDLAVQIRNRIVDGYNEIMRMQI